MREERDNLSQAKAILTQLYLRQLNNLIAQSYRYNRVLASRPELDSREKKALGLIKGIQKTLTGKGRFREERASRTMERIDHFLQGVGLKRGKDGLWETIPERFRQHLEARAALSEIAETPDYQRYNGIKVNAKQAKRLAEIILSGYGFDERGWSIYISPTKKTFSVRYRGKGEIVKQIKIPKTLDKGLIDVLVSLEHEMTHVLQRDNQEEGVGESHFARGFAG